MGLRHGRGVPGGGVGAGARAAAAARRPAAAAPHHARHLRRDQGNDGPHCSKIAVASIARVKRLPRVDIDA